MALFRLGVSWKAGLLFCFAATAAEQPSSLRLVTLEYPPYVEIKDDKPDGLSIWLVEALMRRLQQEHRIEVLPWKRALWQLETGAADAVFPVLKTPGRETKMVFMAEPLTNENVMLFSRRDEAIAFDSELEFLRNKRVCVQQGFSIGLRADELFQTGWMERVNANHQSDCLRMLHMGVARFYLVDRYAGAYVIQQSQYKHVVRPFGEPLEMTPVYLAWNKDSVDEHLITAANDAFEQMLESGEHQRLLQRFQDEVVSR